MSAWNEALGKLADEFERMNAEMARLRAENQKLREACQILRSYALSPHDVSGKAAWLRAIRLISAESEVSDGLNTRPH